MKRLDYWAWNDQVCALLANYDGLLFAPWVKYWELGLSPEQAIIEVIG